MSTIIQKFGGTSVADVDRIAAVADKVARTHGEGYAIVVVLSAMAGETDRLLELARSICEQPRGRELDVLLSTGEQVSVALLSMALASRGVDAVS
ncbi:MAG: aspartate kinase, partial [Proteobacteria bacterium]|nr:aspartate kinase [Pseudomonadota bacterium]